MRYEPITPRDVSLVIRALATKGKWEGTRAGCDLRLVRFHGRDGRDRILYAVRIKHTWISDTGATVAAALREINDLIARAPIHGTCGNRPMIAGKPTRKRQVPFVPLAGPSPDYLPYKDD
jgi:hypothetical protein